jgi:hypothetical protein
MDFRSAHAVLPKVSDLFGGACFAAPAETLGLKRARGRCGAGWGGGGGGGGGGRGLDLATVASARKATPSRGPGSLRDLKLKSGRGGG